MWVCLGFAGIIIGLFMMIILGKLLWLGFLKVSKYLRSGDGLGASVSNISGHSANIDFWESLN